MPRPLAFPNRDRLSVLTAVIVLAYALARFLNLPARVVEWNVFGSPLAVAFDGPFILLVLVAGLISAGAHTLLRSHPYFITDPYAGAVQHWILPGATALMLGAALNRIPTQPLWWVGLGFSVLALLAVLVTEYAAVDPDSFGHDAAVLALTALTYTAALMLFALLYSLSYRAAISASLCATISMLLAWRLLALKPPATARHLLYAVLVGLISAEAFWALTYWRLTPGGAALLAMVPFYICVGLAQHHLIGRLSRAVWIEFGLVALVGQAVALAYALLWSH